MTTITNIDNFQKIIDANASHTLCPYVIHIKGRRLTGLFIHNSSACKKVARVTTLLHNCRCCASRIKRLFNMSDMNGAITLPTSIMSHVGNDINASHYEEIHTISQEACGLGVSGFVFLQDENLLKYQPIEGGFDHIHMKISKENQCDASFTPEEYILFNGAINRYIIQGQMKRLVDRLVEQGYESVLILENCLEKVTYGHTFLMSIRWAKTFFQELATYPQTLKQMNPKVLFMFFMKNLLEGTLGPDLYSGAVCFELATLDQLLGCLEVAKNEKAIMAMCEDRLNPLKYQRPTAPPSVGKINVAKSLLGDFTVSVAAVSDHPNAVPVGRIISPSTSAMSGYDALTTATTKPKSTFASRCAYEPSVTNIKTVKNLVDYVKKFPGIKVQIKTTHSPMYLANTTLDQKFLCVPFMWAFCVISPTSWGMSTWGNITDIIPTWETLPKSHKNVLFVIENVTMPSNTVVCTIPSFLSSEYIRTCRVTFEALMGTMKLIIPENTRLACGIGANVKNENNYLQSPITIKIGGKEIVISKLM